MKDSFNTVKYLTIFWIILILLIAINNISNPENVQIYEFWKLSYGEFNNWGDFFAGFFAPLAFLWLGYGIFLQRAEFSKLSKSVSNQESHMKNQVDLIMSQDLANWYTTYTTNLDLVLDEIKKTVLNEDKSYDEPASVQVLFNDKSIEQIENILLLNKQITSYFFNHGKEHLEKITNMLKIDYEIKYKKDIEQIEILYLKIGALFYASSILTKINITDKYKFSAYLNPSFNQMILSQIKKSKKDQDYEKMQEIFSSLIVIKSEDYIIIGETK